MLKNSILPLDKILSGPTTPAQNKPGSDDNKEVLRIPQCSSIRGDSLRMYVRLESV